MATTIPTVINGDDLTEDVFIATKAAVEELQVAVPEAVATWSSPFAGGVTVGNGTTTAQYTQVGKLVYAELRFVLGSTSAITGDVSVTLPVTADTNAMPGGLGFLRDASTGDRYTVHVHALGATTALVRPMAASGPFISVSGGGLSATNPFTWTTSDEINLTVSYLAA